MTAAAIRTLTYNDDVVIILNIKKYVHLRLYDVHLRRTVQQEFEFGSKQQQQQ